MKVVTNEIILIIMAFILLGAIIGYVYNWMVVPENSISGNAEEIESFLEKKALDCLNEYYGYSENIDCYVVDVYAEEPVNNIKSDEIDIIMTDNIPAGHSKVKIQYDAAREGINLVVI